MYESQRDMLSVYLDEEKAKEALQEFVSSIFASELGFYTLTDAYIKIPSNSETRDVRLHAANQIWSWYIAPTASAPINVSAKRLKYIQSMLDNKEPSIDLFEEEHINVSRDLRQDVIRRFQESKIYKEFLSEKFSFVNPNSKGGNAVSDNASSRTAISRKASQACVVS